MFIKILLNYLLGYVRITVEGYYIERFINICTTNKILIWNLKREKGVRLYLNVGIQDYYRIVEVSKKLKCKVKINKKRGLPFLINKYRKRKLFVISLAILIITIYASSNYIWNIEIKVEDNMQVENIMEDITQAGLKTGIRKSKINIEAMVNQIRLKRDDISWIGVDIKGTNAIVKIVKAKKAPELIDEKEYCNIVAKKSGTITKIIAQNGTAITKVGDRVEEGQVLIQGTMEGKYTGIRYVHSLGEVRGIVEYSKSEKIPLKQEKKEKTGKKENKYEIKINNFQINFYKTLSKFKIYDTIEEEKKLRIFSNLYLPISVNKITTEELEKNSIEYTVEEAIERGTKKLEKEIENEIEEKENILGKNAEVEETEEYVEVSVTYEVIENIGMQEKIEEIEQTEDIQE
ncbi:MAG: sporulation protein YqfD [Clostridia bacterium]|nr:sporulation protein YqfD [Clostridia bacterium]